MKKLLLTLLAALSITAATQAEPIVVLTSGNRLITVDSATPATPTRNVTVTGLTAGETLLGIDFRPATGELFALGSTSRLYTINPFTGVATAIGAAGAFTLNGTRFGFDFNPTVDRIRVTSDTGQNIRLNPTTGALAATDTNLAYGPGDVNAAQVPSVVGAAYTNNFATAASTTLYVIDSARDILAIQNPPNAGTLNTVGSLGVDTTSDVGFDVSGISGTAYATLTVGGVSNLYTINLLSGAATAIGPIATVTGQTIVDIAAAVKPGARLNNVAARGRVGATSEDNVTAGFTTTEGVNSRVYVIARGPSLTTQGVTNPLLDPVLVVFDANRVEVARNDDFGSSPDRAELVARGFVPTAPAEAALALTLPPGQYTAQVIGKNGAGGVATAEVYIPNSVE